MKNLFSILCISFFAQGAMGYIVKTGFENDKTGKLTVNSVSGRWHTESAALDESAVIEHDGGKYLNVASPASPLYRSLYANGDKMPEYRQIYGDVVFDAMIQFTPAELGVPKLEADTKFALSLIADDDNLKTNLVVTAAGPALSGDYHTTTNYCLGVEGVDPSDWYRVTVRVIADTGCGVLGFVVYINGNIVSCPDSDYYDKLPVASDGTLLGGGMLNATSRYLIRNRQFFVSRVRRNANGASQLSAIGFKGVGNIDNLTVCDANESEVAALPPIFALTWSNGVKSFNIDGKIYETASMADDTIYFTPESRSVTVTDVVYDISNKYTNGTWTAKGASIVDGTFFMNGNGASGAINALKINLTVDGVPYDKLGGAIQAAAVASRQGGRHTAIMCDDYVHTEYNRSSIYTRHLLISENSDCILDLAGHTLTLSIPDIPIVAHKGNITIIDSVGGGVITNASSGSVYAHQDGVFGVTDASEGHITVGMEKPPDKGVTIFDRLVPPGHKSAEIFLTVVRGRFTDRAIATQCLNNEVSVLEDCGSYCIVSPKAISPDEIAERTTGEAASCVEMTVSDAVAAVLDDDGAVALYTNLFRRVVTPPAAEGGRYVIAFELDADAVAAVSGATMPDDAVAEIPIADVAVDGGSVDVEKSIPGLYYTVVSGTDPGNVTSPGTSVLGNGGAISLEVPNMGEKGFYRIRIGATPASP